MPSPVATTFALVVVCVAAQLTLRAAGDDDEPLPSCHSHWLATNATACAEHAHCEWRGDLNQCTHRCGELNETECTAHGLTCVFVAGEAQCVPSCRRLLGHEGLCPSYCAAEQPAVALRSPLTLGQNQYCLPNCSVLESSGACGAAGCIWATATCAEPCVDAGLDPQQCVAAVRPLGAPSCIFDDLTGCRDDCASLMDCHQTTPRGHCKMTVTAHATVRCVPACSGFPASVCPMQTTTCVRVNTTRDGARAICTDDCASINFAAECANAGCSWDFQSQQCGAACRSLIDCDLRPSVCESSDGLSSWVGCVEKCAPISDANQCSVRHHCTWLDSCARGCWALNSTRCAEESGCFAPAPEECADRCDRFETSGSCNAAKGYCVWELQTHRCIPSCNTWRPDSCPAEGCVVVATNPHGWLRVCAPNCSLATAQRQCEEASRKPWCAWEGGRCVTPCAVFGSGPACPTDRCQVAQPSLRCWARCSELSAVDCAAAWDHCTYTSNGDCVDSCDIHSSTVESVANVSADCTGRCVPGATNKMCVPNCSAFATWKECVGYRECQLDEDSSCVHTCEALSAHLCPDIFDCIANLSDQQCIPRCDAFGGDRCQRNAMCIRDGASCRATCMTFSRSQCPTDYCVAAPITTNHGCSEMCEAEALAGKLCPHECQGDGSPEAPCTTPCEWLSDAAACAAGAPRCFLDPVAGCVTNCTNAVRVSSSVYCRQRTIEGEVLRERACESYRPTVCPSDECVVHDAGLNSARCRQNCTTVSSQALCLLHRRGSASDSCMWGSDEGRCRIACHHDSTCPAPTCKRFTSFCDVNCSHLHPEQCTTDGEHRCFLIGNSSCVPQCGSLSDAECRIERPRCEIANGICRQNCTSADGDPLLCEALGCTFIRPRGVCIPSCSLEFHCVRHLECDASGATCRRRCDRLSGTDLCVDDAGCFEDPSNRSSCVPNCNTYRESDCPAPHCAFTGAPLHACLFSCAFSNKAQCREWGGNCLWSDATGCALSCSAFRGETCPAPLCVTSFPPEALCIRNCSAFNSDETQCRLDRHCLWNATTARCWASCESVASCDAHHCVKTQVGRQWLCLPRCEPLATAAACEEVTDCRWLPIRGTCAVSCVRLGLSLCETDVHCAVVGNDCVDTDEVTPAPPTSPAPTPSLPPTAAPTPAPTAPPTAAPVPTPAPPPTPAPTPAPPRIILVNASIVFAGAFWADIVDGGAAGVAELGAALAEDIAALLHPFTRGVRVTAMHVGSLAVNFTSRTIEPEVDNVTARILAIPAGDPVALFPATIHIYASRTRGGAAEFNVTSSQTDSTEPLEEPEEALPPHPRGPVTALQGSDLTPGVIVLIAAACVAGAVVAVMVAVRLRRGRGARGGLLRTAGTDDDDADDAHRGPRHVEFDALPRFTSAHSAASERLGAAGADEDDERQRELDFSIL